MFEAMLTSKSTLFMSFSFNIQFVMFPPVIISLNVEYLSSINLELEMLTISFSTYIACASPDWNLLKVEFSMRPVLFAQWMAPPLV